jgi:hypothetical protein
MNLKNIKIILSDLGVQYSHEWGQWLMLRCPFAQWKHAKGMDTKPSFGISVDTNGYSGYNCFTCKSRGRMSSLVRALGHYRNDDPKEVAKLATKTDNLECTPTFDDYDKLPDVEEVQVPLNPAIFDGLYPEAYDVEQGRRYLRDRGVAKDASRRMGLLYDDEQQRVMFPIRDRLRNCYGFSGRSILTPEEYPFFNYPKVRDYNGLKKDAHLLGQEFLTGQKPVVLVEGLFAYARMISLDLSQIADPVASLGSNLSERQASKLYDNGQPVHILYDNDAAGDMGIYGTSSSKGAGKLLAKELRAMVPDPWPEGKVDPDELSLAEVEGMMETGFVIG